MQDPYVEVSGKGLEDLKKAGIETLGPVLEDACRTLNAPFIVAHKEARPFVSLKLALTLDGMIADKNRNSSWITGPAARKVGHKLRSMHQAIMVGAETVRRDNPRLNPRDTDGQGLSNPTRIIVTNGNLDLRGKALLDDIEHHPVWVVTGAHGAESDHMSWAADQGVKILKINSNDPQRLDPHVILNALFQEGIMAVFCEGGAELAGQLIRADLVDRIHIFRAPIALGASAGLPGIGDLGINELSDAKRYRRVGVLEHGPDIEEILEREDNPW
jgi:diaminohydroxyphosphoribosylaminopyrimidine deaminase/5-amino-6-(5-phosphoribosylamino)uracil reductase